MNLIRSTLVLLVCINVSFAQNANFSASNVPTELKFADVTFQFTDQTHTILAQEVAILGKNKDQRNENLRKLSLINSIIQPIVENSEIPEDFKFLSLFSKYQKSLQTSVLLEQGVYWCLDAEKAGEAGLVLDDILDERKHVSRATNGAVTILKRNYALYENWGTTLYSYMVAREVMQSLNISSKWQGETIALNSTRYSTLIQFLAFKYVTELEFNGYKPTDKKVYYEYKKASKKSLAAIATELRVNVNEISNANMWLKTGNVPEGDFTVMVPVTLAKLNELKNTAETRKTQVVKKEMDSGFPVLKANQGLAQGNGGTFYNINTLKGVQAELCDDFVNLSYKGDLHTKLFLKYNDLSKKDPTIIGQVYYLEEKRKKADIPFHIVRQEETMWDVSQRYGVKLGNLLKFNRMDANAKLQLGRVVYLQQIRPKEKQIEYIDVPKEDYSTPNEDDDVKIITETTTPRKTIPKTTSPVRKKQEPIEEEIPLETTNDEEVVPTRSAKNTSSTVDGRANPKARPTEPKTKPKETKSYSEELKDAIPERYANNANGKKYLVHEVRKGETLYRISKTYNVSLDQLYRLNNLKDNIIDIGDRIIVKKY